MEGIGSRGRIAWGILLILVLIILVFASMRLMVDVPNLASGTTPDPEAFEHRYARYPWLAYAHILPGVGYLLLAPIQLRRGFRDRNIRWHRRIGRVAITLGLISGAFGVLFGFFLSFGGPLQASAAVVFGVWFVTCLSLAYRFIRRRDVHHHRRWMIRAFAVGLAVGTIRLWIGLFEATGLLSFRDAFGVAFWLSFVMHAAAAELWLRWRPGS
jgi:uncharacterized membrane protein YozB (DUF420 family)